MGTRADEHTNMVQCYAGLSLIVKHERRLDRIQGGRERDNVALRVDHSNDWQCSKGSRVDGSPVKDQCPIRKAVFAVEKLHNIRE